MSTVRGHTGLVTSASQNGRSRLLAATTRHHVPRRRYVRRPWRRRWCSCTVGAGRSRPRGSRAASPSCCSDAGREVIGVDLLGHGTAPKPHDPEAYADLGARVLDALPDEPVDAIGFSLGAMTLLRVAMRAAAPVPQARARRHRRNVFEPDDEPDAQDRRRARGSRRPDGDTAAQVFVDYAASSRATTSPRSPRS